jgi:hypothetical protein
VKIVPARTRADALEMLQGNEGVEVVQVEGSIRGVIKGGNGDGARRMTLPVTYFFCLNPMVACLVQKRYPTVITDSAKLERPVLIRIGKWEEKACR